MQYWQMIIFILNRRVVPFQSETPLECFVTTRNIAPPSLLTKCVTALTLHGNEVTRELFHLQARHPVASTATGGNDKPALCALMVSTGPCLPPPPHPHPACSAASSSSLTFTGSFCVAGAECRLSSFHTALRCFHYAPPFTATPFVHPLLLPPPPCENAFALFVRALIAD